jgi:hypothetical protein
MKKLEIICVVGIFLFALALRIYAFTYLPRRAITDDAYEYNYIAQNIPNTLKNEPLENRATFLYLGSKRGWLYPLFIAGIYNIFGANDLYVRLIQLIIDALSCCFIYVIGKDMCNKKVGATAALLSSLYPGFIYYSTMLYQETTTIFLLILYVYFLNRALLQKKMYLFLISGIVAVIITFYRSGFLFFSLLTIPMLFLVLRLFYKKDFLPYLLSFITGALCMLTTYGAFSYALCGTLILNKPSIAWSFYETIHRDGWVTDTFPPAPTKELEEIIEEYPSLMVTPRQDLKLPPEVYIKAGIRLIMNKPLEYLSQLIKRFKRMWTYVETYPGRWHSTRVLAQLVFHRGVVSLGLLGIFLTFPIWYYSWSFYFIFLYITIMYIPIIGLPRYAVLGMPLVIILAVYTLWFMLDILATHGRRLILAKRFLICAITTAVLSVLSSLGVPGLLALFPYLPSLLAYKVNILSINLLLLALGYLVHLMLNLKCKSTSRSIYTTAFPLVIVLVLYNNGALTSNTWHEWETPLYTPSQKIKQTIMLPENFNNDEYSQASIVIDMLGEQGYHYSFEIKVNGEQIKYYQDGLKVKEGKFDKKFLGLYKSFLFDTYKLTPEDLRQWYEIELPLHFLKNTALLVIECSLGETEDKKKNSVIVFGDYHTTSDTKLFEGPCIPRSDEDTSFTKIMPYSGDYRDERVTHLNSKETISEYYDGRNWQREDLSSTRGIQSGSYRIRVELIGNNGNQVIW